jgi:CRISPR/Cas system-associated endonuclease Cas1
VPATAPVSPPKDPFIGFCHDLDFGRESLACDVMESLRPPADEFVLSLFRREEIRIDDFSSTDAGCMLGKATLPAGIQWTGLPAPLSVR